VKLDKLEVAGTISEAMKKVEMLIGEPEGEASPKLRSRRMARAR
jgi:hypothetical protein